MLLPAPGTASGVKETKAESTILAHSLVGLAAALDCKLETFSLGSLADALGEAQSQLRLFGLISVALAKHQQNF